MTAVAPRLRGYRILGTIASGASGTVFRAVQEQLAREVAVKVLAPGLFGATETRSRFLREARLQARLSHPALLAVYDAGFAAGQPYLVTELVEGGTLRRRLDFEGRLALDETVRLGLALAQGLGCAHEAGIVHRDLKPENVLLTEAGEIKLADFGLARELSAANSAGTAGGMILGTPGYLAPEVLEGREAGPAADVYGLGVVLYEMSAGRRPFGEESLDLTFRAQLEGVARPLAELDLGIPAELDSLVGQCLQRDPAARPASALEVACRLEAIQEGSGKVPQTVTRTMRAASVVLPGGAKDTVRAGPGRGKAPCWSASRWALGALVSCLLLAAVGAAFWVARGPSQPQAGSDAEVRRPGGFAAGPISQVPRFRVTTGLDRARVWFERPLAEPARLGLRRVGEAAGVLLDFPAGLEVGEVSKLRPGLRYRGELSTAAGTAPVDFGTLGSPRTTSVALLDGDLSSVGTALCSVSGRSLAVVWTRNRKRQEQLLIRESPDAGATWSYPALLPTFSKDIESLAIQHLSPAEVVVGWREERGRQYLCKLARLSLRRMTLEETVDLGEQSGGPSIYPASSGGKAGLSLLLVSGGEVTERRLFPGSLLTTAPRRAFTPPSGEVDFASVELPGGHGQLFWDEPHGSGSNSFWWTHERGDGTWSELVSLARASKFRMSRPASAASGSLVLVGFEMRGRVFLRTSTDGGHLFGPMTEPLADKLWRERPALAAAGGTFYLATVRQTHFAGPRAIDLHSSKDGRNWTLVASQQLLPALEQACRSVRLVAFPEHVVVLAADRQMGFLCVRLPAR